MESLTLSPYGWFYGSNFASFGATKEFLGVLSSYGRPAPIFHIARPHFSEENLRKARGKLGSCLENCQKSMIFHQNRSKKILKHFFENPSLKIFIPGKIRWLRMLSRLGKGRNRFGEWLFGVPESQKWDFPWYFLIFPESFLELSEDFPQEFLEKSEELEPQEHVGTKIIVRLLVTMFLEQETWAQWISEIPIFWWIWDWTVWCGKLSNPDPKLLCSRYLL